jgi:hypothetical protein
MKVFVIDSTNDVKVYASSKEARKSSGGTTFATERDLAVVSKDWPMLRLVAIWNKLPGVTPVRKFRDRNTALRRICAALQDLKPASRTKADLVVGLLQQPTGATLPEIMTATGWQRHSVRAFISAHLSKKLGLRVQSFERQGERAYRIAKKAL